MRRRLGRRVFQEDERLSELHNNQATLRKATQSTTVAVMVTHLPSEREREFGKAICSALIQLAAAIWRYYVDPHPPFVRGK